MRRPTVRWAARAALAMMLAMISTLLLVTASPSDASTVRQQRIAYAKQIYALPLADFLAEQRHWWPIWKAKGVAAAHHADWSTDGCSGPVWAWGVLDEEFSGEKWEDVFTRACIRHDFGYRNFGKGRLSGLAYASTPAERKTVDSRLYTETKARCATYHGMVYAHCMAAATAMYAAVRKGGSDAFYGKGCYAHDLCLHGGGSDRSISVSTANLGTRWEFNDKATSATNASTVAWKVFRDAQYGGKSTCVLPGQTVRLPTETASFLTFRRVPTASSVLKMSGSRC